MHGKTYKDLLQWTIDAVEIIDKHNADKDALILWSKENAKINDNMGTIY